MVFFWIYVIITRNQQKKNIELYFVKTCEIVRFACSVKATAKQAFHFCLGRQVLWSSNQRIGADLLGTKKLDWWQRKGFSNQQILCISYLLHLFLRTPCDLMNSQNTQCTSKTKGHKKATSKRPPKWLGLRSFLQHPKSTNLALPAKSSKTSDRRPSQNLACLCLFVSSWLSR